MRFAAFLTVLALALAAPLARADVFKVHGVQLPNGAVRIGDDDRYRLQESYDAALKYYRSVYRPEKYPRKLIVNQPGIKAIHISNPDPASEWEGFNLYVFQNETRLYILEREGKKTDK
jgi:hypothetical protein